MGEQRLVRWLLTARIVRWLWDNRYVDWASDLGHVRRAQIERRRGIYPCRCRSCQRFIQRSKAA